ncbi:MAG: tRNA 2-selenouridine(34) synthase MnmH [Pseudomonadota bacterium]
MRDDSADFRALFLKKVPLLDTRAPIEFQRGAFPMATNLPLMTDSERHQVGIAHKAEGQDAAIALGHKLVSGLDREERVALWCAYAKAHPDGFLYCFRGGLRSATAQQWMREAGTPYPLVKGGYKAMRQFLLNAMEEALEAVPVLLVAGRTGCGKTRVIESLAQSIDLEGLAQHRGSSFGGLLDPQPAQIDFENALSIDLLRRHSLGVYRLVMEDEGKLVGRIYLPLSLRKRMEGAARVVVEESIEQRTEIIYQDYIVELAGRYAQRDVATAAEHHRQHLQQGLARIRKRLGGARHQALEAKMQSAFDQGDAALHRAWISDLLRQYYDPMYDYQMAQREGEIVYQGNRSAVTEFLTQHLNRDGVQV